MLYRRIFNDKLHSKQTRIYLRIYTKTSIWYIKGDMGYAKIFFFRVPHCLCVKRIFSFKVNRFINAKEN
jgi:hypothetical protein